MSTTEHKPKKPSARTKTPSARTGFFASLGSLLHGRRSGAPSGAPSIAAPSHAPLASTSTATGPASASLDPRRLFALASLFALVSLFALTASPASAKEIYLQGENGEPPSFGTGVFPFGIAIDQATGDMYVAAGFGKLEKFNEAGHPEDFSHHEIEITEYALPSESAPAGIVAGPDGNLWFSDSNTSKIGKITTSGEITEYALPSESAPAGIVAGPDGNLWFSDSNTSEIGKITTSFVGEVPPGTITEYALPSESAPAGIVAGPDGNLWFSDSNTSKIGKITTSGEITEYALPSESAPAGIVAGPDGNLWFSDSNTSEIGKITTSGEITEYALPSESAPAGIVAGPDGNLWFSDSNTSKIGKITTSGEITEYALPSESAPAGIVAGPDGNLWFSDSNTSKIGKITTSGEITEYALPSGSAPAGIVTGPDGNLWFSDSNTSEIGKITTNQLSPGGFFTGVAVDNSTEVSDPSKGDIYVDLSSASGLIVKYNEAGELLASIAAPTGAEAMAVDSSGNLYVASQSQGKVFGFSPSGAPLNSGNPVLQFPGANPSGLAFNSHGDLYISFSDEGRGALEFKPEGGVFNSTPIEELMGTAPGSAANGTYAVAVDLATDDIFVGENSAGQGAIVAFNEHGEEIGTFPHELDGEPEFWQTYGVAVNEAHSIVYGTSVYSSEVNVFHLYHRGSIQTTTVGFGGITADPAGHHRGIERGKIKGGIEYCEETCEAEFETGETVTLTASPAPHAELISWEGCTHELGLTCEVEVGSGVSPVKAVFTLHEHTLTVEKTGTGSGEVECGAGACAPEYLDGVYLALTPIPAPHSQFTGWSGACTNAAGPCVVGRITADTSVTASFAQLKPTITFTGASSVGQSTVTLSAQVNPEGATTTCEFEYGTTTLYGTKAPCPSPGSGAAAVPVSAEVSGLAPLTTYFFRLNATNVGGTTEGEGQTFTTAAPETCATNASLCKSISNKFTIGPAKPQGSAIALQVTLPGPGELIASGKDLEGANVSSLAPGAVSLTLKLSPAGQKALKKAKGHKLKVKVKLTYTPTAATAGSATTTVVFKAAGGKH